MTDEEQSTRDCGIAAIHGSANEEMTEQCNLGESTLRSNAHVSESLILGQGIEIANFEGAHPSLHLSRETTTEIER